MAKSKKRRKLVVFSVIGLVVAGLAAGAFFRKRDVVIPVQTEKVGRRNLVETVKANGKIQPVVRVNISPEVSGEITELPVKEGQHVRKGDLILKIKPDFYVAARNQAQASYQSSLAGKEVADANLSQAKAEFKRNDDLLAQKLVSESAYDQVKATFMVAQAQVSSAEHQVEMARASLASAEDMLTKTTILSPLTGTVSKLNSEVGERVVGTATMAGTEIMTIADLNEMEARVDIGEMDVVLIAPGQCAHLEVDAFKDRKFNGFVTEIANSSKNSASSGGSTQDATKFEVRIRVKEKEAFRPGMSVTAEIETRSRTNVLAVPIACVTTRLPKDKKAGSKPVALDRSKTNSPSAKADPPAKPGKTNSPAAAAHSNTATNDVAADPAESTNAPALEGTNAADKRAKEAVKPIEVVFLAEGGVARMAPVKIGVSDDNYWEITEGLTEGQEVVTGGFRAISRDLEDGKKIRKGALGGDLEKDKEAKKSE
ncbi:MAG: efflux RND transporter periplasmic adaptor subunit [Limisphaerales bacterium]